MTKVYRKTVAEDGTENYEEVDFQSDELNDDDFFKDPRYKDVADRDFNRRQALKEANEKITTLEATPPPPADNDDSVDTVEPGMTEEQITALMAEREENLFSQWRELETTRLSEAQDKETKLNKLITDNSLSADMRDILEMSSDPEKTALSLARNSKEFGGSAGQTAPVDTLKETLARIDKELGISDRK